MILTKIKIEKIEEFALCLKDFAKLKNLDLSLNENLLTKLSAFSIIKNNTSSNVINKIILNLKRNEIEKY